MTLLPLGGLHNHACIDFEVVMVVFTVFSSSTFLKVPPLVYFCSLSVPRRALVELGVEVPRSLFCVLPSIFVSFSQVSRSVYSCLLAPHLSSCRESPAL